MRPFTTVYRSYCPYFRFLPGGKNPTTFVPPRPMSGERNIPGSMAREECRFV